jgi:hypothetical protein
MKLAMPTIRFPMLRLPARLQPANASNKTPDTL